MNKTNEELNRNAYIHVAARIKKNAPLSANLKEYYKQADAYYNAVDPDEPFSALDVPSAEALRGKLLEL